MGKPTICIGENKGADQLRGNREADQRLCFRYTDSTIPLLGFRLLALFCDCTARFVLDLFTLLVFPRGGSYNVYIMTYTFSDYMRTGCAFSIITLILMFIGHGFAIYTIKRPRYIIKRLTALLHLMTGNTI